jgi:hypothetical protein
MPQLDFFSISNQFFWGIICFALFFYMVNFIVLPALYASIFARNYFITTGNSDSFDSLYYSFSGFYFFFQLFSDYLNCIIYTLNDINSLNSDYILLSSEFINFEIFVSSELSSIAEEIF